jgi:pimeloyl-ACP methyl ester carboxylesterase
VDAVKAHWACDRVILVGHSFGAKVVREAYRQARADIVGLVPIDGSLYVGGRDALL